MGPILPSVLLEYKAVALCGYLSNHHRRCLSLKLLGCGFTFGLHL
jgi:hypothetical protein